MEIHYTAEHEWIAVADGIATVGITDHAQRALGDLVFVQLPEVGAALAKAQWPPWLNRSKRPPISMRR
jgi:glycine cleavage system H protein